MNQRLVAITPSSPYPENPTQLIPLGNGQFRGEAATGGGPVGETVRFVEQNGKVVRIDTGGSYSHCVH